jgi:hypothetical protein
MQLPKLHSTRPFTIDGGHSVRGGTTTPQVTPLLNWQRSTIACTTSGAYPPNEASPGYRPADVRGARGFYFRIVERRDCRYMFTPLGKMPLGETTGQPESGITPMVAEPDTVSWSVNVTFTTYVSG